MGETTVVAWKCDVCGWTWMKTEVAEPEACPNRKCRSRKWNKLKAGFLPAPTIPLKARVCKACQGSLRSANGKLVCRRIGCGMLDQVQGEG
jgi:hypothetical protein